MLQAPAAAPVRLKVQVILVALTTTTLVPFILGLPAFVNLTVAPLRKPVPVGSVILTVLVLTPVLGVMDITVGTGLVKDTVAGVPIAVLLIVPVMLAVPAVVEEVSVAV